MSEEITISKIDYDYLKITEFKYKTIYNCLLDNAIIELWDDELRFSYDKFVKTFTSLEYDECKRKLDELKIIKNKEGKGD